MRGGVIVAQHFDVDKSRPIRGSAGHKRTLMAEFKDPARGFDGVFIGEPDRAFYGNQYGLTFPLFEHHGIPLWARTFRPSCCAWGHSQT